MKELVKLMNDSIEKLNKVREKLHNHEENLMGINIVIDHADPTKPIFVEIETDEGESIGIGEFLPYKDGLNKLRITAADIIQHEKL